MDARAFPAPAGSSVTTSEREQIYSLDHLRFFAASLVFAHHFSFDIVPSPSNGWLQYIAESWLRWGSNGVSLFLVLSGFIFVTICRDKEIIYHKFIINRVLRIFPLLIVVMLLLLTTARATWSPLDLLRFIFLQMNTGNAVTGWGSEFLPFGITWTIAVEFQFYLLFPLLLVIFRKKDGLQSIFWMIGTFCLLRLFLGMSKGPEIYYNAYHTLLSRADQFLIGMLAARVWMERPLTRAAGIFLLFAGLSILTADVLNHGVNLYRLTFGLTIEAMAWALVILGYASSFRASGEFSRFLSKLGNLTYSLYLLHLFFGRQLLERALEKGWGLGSPVFDFLIYAYLPTLALSVVTYMGIERPFQRMKVSYLR